MPSNAFQPAVGDVSLKDVSLFSDGFGVVSRQEYHVQRI